MNGNVKIQNQNIVTVFTETKSVQTALASGRGPPMLQNMYFPLNNKQLVCSFLLLLI